MKSRKKDTLYRFSIITIIALFFNVAVYIVATALLQSQAERIQAENGTLQIALPEVVVELFDDPVQSLQWFLLEPIGEEEEVVQQSGIAESWPKPFPPKDVVVQDTQFGSSVLIAWTRPTGQTYDSVEIYRARQEPKGVNDMELVQSATFSTGEWLDTQLENNVTYYYALRSIRNGEAAIKPSNLTDIFTVIPTDITPPPAPQWITVTPYHDGGKEETGLIVEWEHAVTDDVIKYRLYRSTRLGELGELIQSVTPDVKTILDPTVQPGVTYYYAVTAVDGENNESTTDLQTSLIGNTSPFIQSIKEALERIHGS